MPETLRKKKSIEDIIEDEDEEDDPLRGSSDFIKEFDNLFGNYR